LLLNFFLLNSAERGLQAAPVPKYGNLAFAKSGTALKLCKITPAEQPIVLHFAEKFVAEAPF
jgi:hypothetical protein